ncbi:glyoxylase-like metal-dependent hydrolase (beta-lactamase superfamily II) [Phyllobacterium ifriqiyense]|uniref:Glyoxylase-like metal-dependent hydrolase (Beta-lactamase superfamily II) n=1 Tax=Phyllobacterium ifriqiyense TaxID=314238 RepID=A0ABU0S5W3_9HYPH|nr:MBL fold metallo-hydrolase [Phyllobacterium ifriqiyense]MDQ0996140.1 glyoxylase-like metal-dependent hydrolase (beta-lactamase superfamily II) [Phyllobacterium ifriqiyense]
MHTRRSLLINCAKIALAAGTSTAVPAAVFAKAPMVGKQAAGFYRVKLGSYEITALSDGTAKLPMSKIYKNIGEEEAETYLVDRYQAGAAEVSVNAFLVNTGERLVLIDAGTGNLLGPSLGRLVSNIEASGYKASDIDDVILTHIHADHSGGLIANGSRVYENAVLHVNRREELFWLKADAESKVDKVLGPQITQAEQCVGPYADAGRLKTFDDNAAPVPGFGSVLLSGHTPGHSGIIVESQGEKIVFWGDVAHGDVLQYDHPEVTVDFDVDQKAAAATRAVAFAEAADQRYLVAGAHHAFPGIGHVRRDDSNYEWVPIVYRASY